jgi:hypothetical protein
MTQAATEYKGFSVSAAGPYQKSDKFPAGHWYGTMEGRIITAPANTAKAAIRDAQVYVDRVVGDFLQQHGEEGQELLDLTEALLQRQ